MINKKICDLNFPMTKHWIPSKYNSVWMETCVDKLIICTASIKSPILILHPKSTQSTKTNLNSTGSFSSLFISISPISILLFFSITSFCHFRVENHWMGISCKWSPATYLFTNYSCGHIFCIIFFYENYVIILVLVISI